MPAAAGAEGGAVTRQAARFGFTKPNGENVSCVVSMCIYYKRHIYIYICNYFFMIMQMYSTHTYDTHTHLHTHAYVHILCVCAYATSK